MAGPGGGLRTPLLPPSRPPPSEAEADGSAGPPPSGFAAGLPPFGFAGPASGALVADTDPRRGLSHREATARLGHFGANAPPRPPASLGSPPTSRSAFLAALASPALRACWFALACQLLHAILAEIRDANAHETLPEMALDDTDDSAGPGRGARASWLDAALLAALLASLALATAASARRAQSVVDAGRALAGGADGTDGVALVRDGVERRADARELVPGDLVRLAAGDKAPADCVLVDHPETTSAIVEVDEEEVPPSVASENNTTNASRSARGRRRVVRAGDEIFAGATCVRGETRAVVTRTGAAILRGGGDADGGFFPRRTRQQTRGGSNATRGGSNATARQPPRGSLDATLDGFARASHALCVLACFCVGATLFAFSDDDDEMSDERGALPLGSDAPRGIRSAGSDVRAADFLALVSFAAALCVAASPASLPAFRAASDASALLALRRHRGVRHCVTASACYDLARCDAVCCDKAGTVTRGACELTGVHATTPGVSSRDVLVAAALATRWREKPRDAVDAMVLRSVDVAPLSESYAVVKHQPFDAASKTTSCTLERIAAEPGSRGTRFRVCKGAPAEVAAVCDNGEACEEACERVLAACAEAGERCFAVAANHRDNPPEEREREAAGAGADDAVDENASNASADSGGDGWMLLGLVTFVDPPRADARSSVRRFEDLGVKVVLVTGDAEPAARETCRLIGLRGGAGGDDAGVRTPSDLHLPFTRRPGNIARADAEMEADAETEADPPLFPCVAFADASPAEKRLFVASLRRDRVAAFVGRGVADAAAMGEADVAVAALGASDAALSAADAILGAPGLATLASAIARSRASFAKIRAHVAHRQGSASHALLFFAFACLFARPRDFDPAWPETFHPPVASVVMIAASLHLTLVAFASDDPNAPVARRPERLRLPALAFAATARGAVAAASSVAFLAVALGANRGFDRHGRRDHPIAALVFGVSGAPLAYGEVLTASFLEFSVSSALGAFSARTTGPFWESAPGASALASVVFSLFAATALALRWPFNANESSRADFEGPDSFASSNHSLGACSLGAGTVAGAWVWAATAFVVADAAKILAYRALARAGWLPEHAKSCAGAGGGFAVGGARWFAAHHATAAELRRVAEDAEDAIAEARVYRGGGDRGGGDGSSGRSAAAAAAAAAGTGGRKAKPGRRPPRDRASRSRMRRRFPGRRRRDGEYGGGDVDGGGYPRGVGESIPEGVEEEETESEGEDEGGSDEASESSEASELSSSGLRNMSPGIWGGSGGAPAALTPAALDVLGGGDDRVARWVTALGETESFAAAASSSDAGSSRLSRKNESSAPDGSSIDGSSVDPFESSRGRNFARNHTATHPPDGAASSDPASRAAALAGSRLPAPPPPSFAFREPRGRGRGRPPPKNGGDDVDDFGDDFAATSRSAAEAAAEAAVPRADRLRLHPEYVAATADEYARLARAHDWRDAFARLREESRARPGASRPGVVTVLDVGCGAGAFTAALAASGILPRGGGGDENSGALDDPWIEVDLLDPSPSALRAASASLAPPMTLGALRCAAVQDFHAALVSELQQKSKKEATTGDDRRSSATTTALLPPTKQYDVVWAHHALATVPIGRAVGRDGVDRSLASFLRATRALTRPGGICFVTVVTADSHDARFHELYHREFGRGSAFHAVERARLKSSSSNAFASASTATATAEHVEAALAARGAPRVRTDAACATVVDAADATRLEAFLRGTAGDDAVSLDTMLANPRVGAYVASCRTPDGRKYAFPQNVAHFTM